MDATRTKVLKAVTLNLRHPLEGCYDVAATNPPYTGSTNTGPAPKKCVQRTFNAGKPDLYATLIVRKLEIATGGGCVGRPVRPRPCRTAVRASLDRLPPDRPEKPAKEGTAAARAAGDSGPGWYNELNETT